MRPSREFFIVASAVTALSFGGCGTQEVTPDEIVQVNCDNVPTDAATLSLDQLAATRESHHLHIEVSDQHKTLLLTVNTLGRVSINGTNIMSTDAGRVIEKLPSAHVIAGVPSPNSNAGYYAGDEGLTVACDKATVNDVRRYSTTF